MKRKLTPKNQHHLLKRMFQNSGFLLLFFIALSLSSQSVNTTKQSAPLLIEAHYRPLSKTIIPYVSVPNTLSSDNLINVSIGEYSIEGTGANTSNQDLKEIISQYDPSNNNKKNLLLAEEIEKQSLGVIYSESKKMENWEGTNSGKYSFRPFSGSPGKVYYLQASLENAITADSENKKTQILFIIPKKAKISYPETLEFSAKGTGRTTGHIITLTVKNTGDKIAITEIGPSIVPCGEKKKNIAVQGFFTYETYPISLAPGESIQIPIQGYCTNNDCPPPEPEDSVTSFEEWITPQDVGFIPDPTIPFPKETPFQVNKNYATEEIQLVYPGTDTPFPYHIDLKKYPIEAAPIIFFTGESLLQTIDEEIQKGALDTPISKDSVKLKETVVQHDMWLVTSALDSDEENDYGSEDFRDNTITQIEKTTGKTMGSLPKDTQEGVDAGIVDLFDGIMLVGEKAKVLKKNMNVTEKD